MAALPQASSNFINMVDFLVAITMARKYKKVEI